MKTSFWILLVLIGVILFIGLLFAWPAFNRYQILLNEKNTVQVNDIKIAQTQQLVEVEKQKAQIKIVEATGIAESQKIINATLTDKYLQHEAIQSQEKLANSPNHTTVYIPSGQNGIPLVKTIDEASSSTK